VNGKVAWDGGDDDDLNLPIADAGTDQFVPMGATVYLDGSGSSDDGSGVMTYAWSFDTMPTGSTAALSDTSVIHPTFVADLAGSYVVGLVDTYDLVSSLPDFVTITAGDCLTAGDAVSGDRSFSY